MINVPPGVILKSVPKAIDSARIRCPVEVSVGALDHPVEGPHAVSSIENVQRGQCAPWRDFEDRATGIDVVRRRDTNNAPTIGSRAVEVAVGALHQHAGPIPITAVRLSAKIVERGQGPLWGDLEDRAAGLRIYRRRARRRPGAAQRGCPIEIPFAALHQPRCGGIAACSVEGVQSGQRA